VNQTCAEYGYGESFLTHILKYQPNKVHLLDVQYRLEPSPLLDFVNGTFYQNRLVSDDTVKNRVPTIQRPFVFVSTSEEGYGSEEQDHFSFKNFYEVGGMHRFTIL
jgi:superfamily I DNA and/or RNA helicase